MMSRRLFLHVEEAQRPETGHSCERIAHPVALVLGRGGQPLWYGYQPAGKDFRKADRASAYLFIHSFIACFPIRTSGALQQTFYGSPPACPVLGFPPPCIPLARLVPLMARGNVSAKL